MVSGIVSGVATIGGALIGSSSSKKATEAIQDGSQAQIDLSRDIYNDQRALQQPFYQTGVAANSAAAELLGINSQSSTSNQYGGSNSGYRQYAQQGNSSNRYGGGGVYGREDIYSSLGNNPTSYRYEGGGSYRSGGSYGGEGLTNQRLTNKTSAPSTPQAQTTSNQLTSNGQPVYQNAQLTALQESPGYQFRMQEGQNQLEQSAFNRGGGLSGAALRGQTRYAQDYASNEYNQRFNQLQALSGGGQTASSNIQNAGTNFASSANSAYGTAANAQAQDAQTRGSIYGTALGSLGSIFSPTGG